MGSTLMCEIRAGRSPYNRADAHGTTSPASTQRRSPRQQMVLLPETQRQVRPAWAPCVPFCRALTRKVTHTVKLVRQRSPKQHPKESRQFF